MLVSTVVNVSRVECPHMCSMEEEVKWRAWTWTKDRDKEDRKGAKDTIGRGRASLFQTWVG